MSQEANAFRAALDRRIALAARAGRQSVEVTSGDLHREVGGYPGPDHRMPSCCNVMTSRMRAGDIIVSQPPKGKGATLTVRYLVQ